MANQVTLTFAGDAKSLERTFSKVGAGAKDMASDMDKASGDVKRFGSRMDDVNSTVDTSEGKFMGAADLLDGLGGAFGLPLEGATGLARSFGDLAGGMTTVVIPAVTGVLTKLGIMTGATAAQTAATGTATAAQTGLNAALLANPIGLVVLAVAALVGGFILAWKHSETFRDIVRAGLDIVKKAATGLVDFFLSIPEKIGAIGSKLTDVISAPFKLAFNTVARLWNNTVGKLSFRLPSWVPGLGGNGFDMPNIPTFHQGGMVPGNPGQAVPILALAGETVVPAGAGGGGGPVVVNIMLGPRTITRVIRDEERRSGPIWVRAT